MSMLSERPCDRRVTPARTRLDTVVACGQIEGQVRLHLRSDAPPGLVIAMQEVGSSGYAGVAWLSPADNGGTMVTLFIAEGLIGQGPR